MSQQGTDSKDNRTESQKLDDFVTFLSGKDALPAERAMALCDAMQVSPKVTDVFLSQMEKSLAEKGALAKQFAKAIEGPTTDPDQILFAVLEQPKNRDLKEILLETTRATQNFIKAMENNPELMEYASQSIRQNNLQIKFSPELAKTIICSRELSEPLMEIGNLPNIGPERTNQFLQDIKAEQHKQAAMTGKEHDAYINPIMDSAGMSVTASLDNNVNSHPHITQQRTQASQQGLTLTTP